MAMLAMGMLALAAGTALCGCAEQTVPQDRNVIILHVSDSAQKDPFLVQAAAMTQHCGYEYFRLFAPDGEVIAPDAPLPAETNLTMRMYGPRDNDLTQAGTWNIYSVFANFHAHG